MQPVLCCLSVQEIHNPRQQQQTPASSSRGGRGGGRGRGRGRGRGNGNGSRANSMDVPDETAGVDEYGEDSASVAPTGWEEQDGEEFGGGRWACGDGSCWWFGGRRQVVAG